MGIDPVEVSFEAKNFVTSYPQILSYIVGVGGTIEDKDTEKYIKAKIGNKIKARLKGFAKCDIRELPIDIFVDFTNKKITIKDDSGPGIKWGISKRIIKNMTETMIKIKELIENVPQNVTLSTMPHEDEPLKILKVRFAKGEITKEEFDKMKEDLNDS